MNKCIHCVVGVITYGIDDEVVIKEGDVAGLLDMLCVRKFGHSARRPNDTVLTFRFADREEPFCPKCGNYLNWHQLRKQFFESFDLSAELLGHRECVHCHQLYPKEQLSEKTFYVNDHWCDDCWHERLHKRTRRIQGLPDEQTINSPFPLPDVPADGQAKDTGA